MLDNILLGFSVAIQPINLLYAFLGALVGTMVGVLPGLGPLATMALLLPLTYYLPPDGALMMLAGIYYGSQYGGSTTAILVNMPGETSSAVTCLEGHQMARNGRAGVALAIAGIGSFIAGTIATGFIAFLSKPLAALGLLFEPAEYCALMILGLTCAVALARGSLLKAIAMAILGMMFGLVGTDVNTGVLRYTFGVVSFYDGLGVVAVAMGLFGIAEVVSSLSRLGARAPETSVVSTLWPTKTDVRRSIPAIGRGTLLGSVLGVLPGGGVTLASYAAYSIERKFGRFRSEFGQGAIEGVAGPEAANNAAAQTSFIPMLTLGIPSNAVMAILMGAMMIQGVAPGPQVMTTRPDLFWGLIASMWIGNVMLLVINLPLVGIWVSFLRIPYKYLFPAILLFACIGAYSVANEINDILLLAAFGLIGVWVAYAGFEAAPLLLGFVLGPLMETNLRRALTFSDGDYSVLVTRPISATILLMAVLLLIASALPNVRRQREKVFVESD